MAEALAEADAAVSSPPDTTGDSKSSTAQATQTGTGGDSKGVPPSTATADRDAAILARLDKGESVQKVRQNPTAVTPSPKADATDGGGTGTADDEAERDAGAPAEGSAYEGLDAKAENQLRRAGLLSIEPEDWQALSKKGRDSMVAAAKRILADRGRVGQQLGQARRAPAPTNHDDVADPGDEAGDQGQLSDGTAEDEPAYTAAQWRALQRGQGRAQQQPPARAGAQPPAQQQDEFAVLRETFGDDAVAPLEAKFAQQQQELAQAVQQNTVFAGQVNALAKSIYQPQEREAFKKLEEQAGKVEPAVREKIIRRAFSFMKDASQDGEEMEWRDALLQAGRAVLDPDIKRSAQQDLLTRRDNSIRATPTKAAGIPRVARALSKEDKDAAAMNLLDQGKSVAEVRGALTD